MAKPFQRVAFPRTHMIRFRATHAEHQLLTQMASDCGLTMSDFVRKQALSRRFRSRIAATIINELSAISATLKQCEGLEKSPEFRQILTEIADAIERIPVEAEMF